MTNSRADTPEWIACGGAGAQRFACTILRHLALLLALAAGVALGEDAPGKCNPSITLIGDSLLQGDRQEVMRRLLQRGYCVHDHSQSGQTLEAAVRAKSGRAANFYLSNTSYVLLGTNDFINGKSWSRTLDNMARLLRQISTRQRVVCLGPPAIGKQVAIKGNFPYHDLNNAYEFFSQAGLCDYIDLRGYFPDASDSEWFKADRVHLNAQGSHRLADIIHGSIATPP